MNQQLTAAVNKPWDICDYSGSIDYRASKLVETICKYRVLINYKIRGFEGYINLFVRTANLVFISADYIYVAPTCYSLQFLTLHTIRKHPRPRKNTNKLIRVTDTIRNIQVLCNFIFEFVKMYYFVNRKFSLLLEKQRLSCKPQGSDGTSIS